MYLVVRSYCYIVALVAAAGLVWAQAAQAAGDGNELAVLSADASSSNLRRGAVNKRRGEANNRRLQSEVIYVEFLDGHTTDLLQAVEQAEESGGQGGGAGSGSRNLQQSVVTIPVSSLNMWISADAEHLRMRLVGGTVLVADYTISFSGKVKTSNNETDLWSFEFSLTFDNTGDDEVRMVGSVQYLFKRHPTLDTPTGSSIPFDLTVQGPTRETDSNPQECFRHSPIATNECDMDIHSDDCRMQADMNITATKPVQPPVDIDGFQADLLFIHNASDPTCNGDPHFTTWGGESFDYHGQCDLVLIQHPNFDHGLGLHAHARTRLMSRGVGRDRWSRMDSVAIRIGEDVLEVHGASQKHWINGVPDVPLPATIGGYQVQPVESPISSIKRYAIEIGGPYERMWIKTFNEFVYFEIEGSSAQTFQGSYGLFGDYTTGHKMARDKITILEDPNEYGQEWQVRPSIDRKLFRKAEGVQYPNKCVLPKKHNKNNPVKHTSSTVIRRRRRRLGGSVTDKQAKEACTSVYIGSGTTQQDCIFDVMVTGDLDMAMAYEL